MNHIVDNAPIAEAPPTKAERRDIQVEREAVEYTVMYDEVWAEFKSAGKWCGRVSIHNEAMRRLREKYESACGK